MDSPVEKREVAREIAPFEWRDECGEMSAQEKKDLLPAEVLATVSHELRSPLTAMKGYATTLLLHEDRITPKERHEFLLAINEAGERLEKIIVQMFELAQLEIGKVAFQVSPVNLPHLIRETLISVEQGPGRQSGASRERNRPVFVVHLEDSSGQPGQEEPVIQADRRLLERMLFYLFENALRHSPEDSLIEVTIRPVVEGGQVCQRNGFVGAGDEGSPHRAPGKPTVTLEGQPLVEICVRDQGQGIAPEHLERIFERFHRTDMQLTREGGGLGLGLAICQYIVMLHQGNIWAESEVGAGSVFHIQLPRDGPVQE